MKDFQNFIRDYVREAFRLFPSVATYMGIHDHDCELESFSSEARQEAVRIFRKFSNQRDRIDARQLSLHDYVDFTLMGIELFEYKLLFEELKPWERDPGLYSHLALLSAYHLAGRNHVKAEEKGRALLSRLKQYPRLLTEGKKNLKNPPLLFSQTALEVTLGGIEFFKGLKFGQRHFSSKLKKEIENEKIRVLQAFSDYAEWIRKDLLPRSGGEFSVGRSVFERLLRECHTLPYTAKDLKEMGEESFKRTISEMKVLAKKIDPEKSWKEILFESSRRHPGQEKLVSAYRKEMEKTKVFVQEKNLVPIPAHDWLVVDETPLFYRSFLPFAAYMPPPAFQPEGGGEFWVTPVPSHLPRKEAQLRLSEHAFHKIPVIVLHETYPGHHVQFSFLKEISSPLVKRSTSTVSCEGWAFYCEEMMKEAGFYTNPISLISQRRDELWRIARVILDVGLHTEGMKAEKAVDFLVEKVGFPEAMAWGEIKRYARDPTQPMSYFVGKNEILKLREAYRQKQKGKFKLFNFHKAILECGAVPVGLAEKKVLAES